MATFVLVHGAWHGSWCWKHVRRALQEQRHQVFTPTLTGVGERVHLLSPAVNLQTHIDDIANLIRWEELTDIILCGHSYGGAVVGGVADALPDRISALLYLDAFVLDDGQSVYDVLPPEQRQMQIEGMEGQGEGWKVPPIPAEAFNVNLRDREWVDRQCTFQPSATFEQKMRLSGAAAAIPVTAYIGAAEFPDSPFAPFMELGRRRGWAVSTMACGHDIMIDMPDALVEELLKLAQEPRVAA